jgi:biotin carboxyl carrier protein
MTQRLMLDGVAAELHLLASRPVLRLRIGEKDHEIVEALLVDGSFEITIDGRTHRGWRYAAEDAVHVRLDGRTYVVGIDERGVAGDGGRDARNEVRADMPGTVVAIHREIGSAVEEGEALVTIESMKLQVTLVAPRAGTIAHIAVDANQSFDRGAVLVALAPEREA